MPTPDPQLDAMWRAIYRNIERMIDEKIAAYLGGIVRGGRLIANNITGTVPGISWNPMTALGDILYGAASGVATRLAGNTTSTRKFLRQVGDGAASAAPAWDTLQAGDYPDMVGDSGAGGTKGAVPAPAAGDAAAGKYLKADGTWAVPSAGTLSDHDHSGDAGDGGTFDAANLTSGVAPDGYVLTADGVGGAAWEAVPAGGTPDASTVTYTPAVLTDWNLDTDPGNVDDALDQLAQRVDDLEAAAHTVVTTIVMGDASDPLTTGTDKNPIPMEAPCTLTITEVRLKVKTAPTGAAIIVDVNKGGTTIFTTQSNRPQIADGATEGNTTTIEVNSLVKGDDLTFDIDQVGSSTAGSQLMVEIICTQGVS